MYKKILMLVFAIMFAIFASGCVKYSTRIEIDKNDKLVLSQKILIDKKTIQESGYEFDIEKLSEQLGDYIIKNRQKQYETNGYQLNDYEDSNFTGESFTKKHRKAEYLNVEELPDGFMLPNDAKKPIDIKRGPFGAKYKIDLKYDPKKAKQLNENIYTAAKSEANIVGVDEEQIKNMSQNAVAELTIKIPKKAKKHNATSVNEATHEYYWNLGNPADEDKLGSNEIILEYQKTNFLSLIFVLLLIIGTIYVRNKNKVFQYESDETKDAF